LDIDQHIHFGTDTRTSTINIGGNSHISCKDLHISSTRNLCYLHMLLLDKHS